MTTYVHASNVPDQYEIHEQDGERFIFAQPSGEKIIVRERPSLLKIIVVAGVASAALVAGLLVWLAYGR